MKKRLDQELFSRHLVSSRSQAESYIRMGKVVVNGKVITKTGHQVSESDTISVEVAEQYVSRAGQKLASVAQALKLDFADKIVLDVGSSTGGFTDYALRHGAKKVIAVEVGTNQLHPTLQNNPQIELHEQTDIRNFQPTDIPDFILIDVSFISLREILPHVAAISGKQTYVVAMAKPQFEAGPSFKHKGVIKNDNLRRQVLDHLETFMKKYFVIQSKADSEVAGEKGNRERFYLLSIVKR